MLSDKRYNRKKLCLFSVNVRETLKKSLGIRSIEEKIVLVYILIKKYKILSKEVHQS